MAKLGPGKQLITVYLEKDVVQRIDRMAAATDKSRSGYIERLLEEHLHQDEATIQAFTDPVLMAAFMEAFGKPEVLSSLVRTMRQDLTDEQLQLFQEGISSMAEKTAKRARSKKSAKKKQKRTKRA